MKIYQIHKYGGEWEDSYDYIVGSYLYRHRAEEIMEDLKQKSNIKHEEVLHCQDCPIWNLGNEGITEEDVAKECITYCDRFCRDDYDDGSFDCNNWQSYYEKPMYRIEEIEVEM